MEFRAEDILTARYRCAYFTYYSGDIDGLIEILMGGLEFSSSSVDIAAGSGKRYVRDWRESSPVPKNRVGQDGSPIAMW